MIDDMYAVMKRMAEISSRFGLKRHNTRSISETKGADSGTESYQTSGIKRSAFNTELSAYLGLESANTPGSLNKPAWSGQLLNPVVPDAESIRSGGAQLDLLKAVLKNASGGEERSDNITDAVRAYSSVASDSIIPGDK